MDDVGYGDGTKKTWGALMMFFFTFFSYTPLATGIDEMVINATTTNAVWVFMDGFFGLFWTILSIFWLMLALNFMIGEI